MGNGVCFSGTFFLLQFFWQYACWVPWYWHSPSSDEDSMKFRVLSCFCLLTAIVAAFARAWGAWKEEMKPPLEDWVGTVRISSSWQNFNVCDALNIDSEARLFPKTSWAWAPFMDGHQGIVVLHPFSLQEPARITISLPTNGRTSQVLIVSARSSDFEPGAIAQVIAGGRIYTREAVDKSWHTWTSIVPHSATMPTTIAIEFFPQGWNHEYVYVDSIKLK